MSDERVTRLRHQIVRAFEDVPNPGDVIEAHIDIDSTDVNDIEGFRSCFLMKTWRSCEAFDLDCHWDLINTLTDSGFRYWVPAFMLHMFDPSSANGLIPTAIAHRSGQQGTMEQFSESERTSVFAFLEFFDENT